MTRAPCLRCGDFIEGTWVPLCAKCLDIAPTEERPFMVVPPRELAWKQLWAPVTVALLVTPFIAIPILRIIVAMKLGRWELPVYLGVLTPTMTVLVQCGCVPWFAHVGYRAWKDLLLERMGFAPEPMRDQVALVFLTRRTAATMRVAAYGAIALLLERPEGLVLVSNATESLVVPRERIARVAMTRLWLCWPPRAAVEIEMVDGTKRFVAFLEESSFRANAARARALAERLSPRRGA